jgi:hypothetical protein
MATREEVLTNLTKAAKQGNIRDAYRDFEELPFVDQVAISISPGIGDALAVYEIGEFGARGAKNIAEKDFLGALGNYGLSGLSAISILPLFRLFRGAKAIKAIDPVIDAPRPRKGKTGLKGPGEYQAEQAAKKTTENLPLPKVEEFKPLSLDEMTFKGTRPVGPSKVGSDGKVISGYGLGLTSKAAKFINTNKKLPNQTSMVTYINALKKGGISNGELRLLNLTDEFGDVHPKLLDEIQSSNPLDKITRQRLARYIKENQSSIDKGGIQKRKVSDRELEAPGRLISGNKILDNETEFTYHLPKEKYERGAELGRHYRGYDDHEAHYVFDAAADLKMPDYDTYADSLRIMPFDSKVIGPPKPILDKGDKVLNLGRIQSDYSKELGQAFTRNKNKQIELILSKQPIKSLNENLTIAVNRIRDELGPDLIGSPDFLRQNNFFSAIASAARKTSNLESSDQLQKAFIKDQQRLYKLVKEGKTLQTDEYLINPTYLSAFAKTEGASIKDSINKIVKTVKEFNGVDIFEPFIKPTKEVKEVFSVSPYKDTRKLMDAKKAKDAYNKVVPKINKISAKELELQKKITDSNLTPDSPSYIKIEEDLKNLNSAKLKLMPSSFDDIGEFTLTRDELKNATGKEFTESLGKSLDEIFYELEAIAPGSPAVRQKYGPGTPTERAAKYFDEMVNNPSPTFDIGNGVRILKRATKVKTDNIPGIRMDPYAVDNKTVAYKLPIRSRFLEAVSNDYDGFSLDSAAKRLGDEGGQDREFLEKLYDIDAPREIEKMLKELGVDPKEYMGKVDPNINQKFSGTYVKIDDEIRKLVKEKGIDAFKDGGAVDDDLPDVQPVQSNYATYQDRQGFESGGVVEEAAKLAAARARIDLDIENEARVEAGLLPLPPLLDNPPVNYATEEDLAKSTYAADAAKEAKNYARQVEIAKYNDPHLYEIYSIEDPETRQRALDEYKDFSVFRDVLPFIPINVKQHAYHMAGGKGDVDINDLTKKEQEAYYRYAQEIMASGELPLDQDSSVMMDYSAYGTESDFGDIYWGKKNLGLSDEQLEAWKKGEIYINYPGGRNGAVESYSYEEFLEKYPGALDSDGQSIGDLITNMQDPNYVAKTFTGKADINYNKDSNTITVTDNYNHNRHPDATNKDIIEAFIADPSLYAALKAGALLKNADGSVIELDLGSPQFVQGYPTGKAIGGPVSIESMLAAL